MAETLAACGVAASVFQIVDFSAKVVKHAFQLLQSGNDALRENIETEKLARDYRAIADDADTGGPLEATGKIDEGPIHKLGSDCKENARQLVQMLEDLKVASGCTGAKKLYHTARAAARAQRHKKKIEERRRYLQELNGQLTTALLQLLQ